MRVLVSLTNAGQSILDKLLHLLPIKITRVIHIISRPNLVYIAPQVLDNLLDVHLMHGMVLLTVASSMQMGVLLDVVLCSDYVGGRIKLNLPSNSVVVEDLARRKHSLTGVKLASVLTEEAGRCLFDQFELLSVSFFIHSHHESLVVVARQVEHYRASQNVHLLLWPKVESELGPALADPTVGKGSKLSLLLTGLAELEMGTDLDVNRCSILGVSLIVVVWLHKA